MLQDTKYDSRKRGREETFERHPFIEEMRSANMIPRSVSKDELEIRDIWFINGFKDMFGKKIGR